jgi:5-methylcytosine-specific restriction endonuclease McrA
MAMEIPVDQVQLPFVSRSRYRALVLDPGMQPIDVVNWQRALVLDMLAKVEVLEYYQDVTVNSVSAEFFLPAVLMAKKVGRNASKFSRVPLNRRNIMIRDNLTCQYCGKKPSRGKLMGGLTLDHIVPQSRNGGVRCCPSPSLFLFLFLFLFLLLSPEHRSHLLVVVHLLLL